MEDNTKTVTNESSNKLVIGRNKSNISTQSNSENVVSNSSSSSIATPTPAITTTTNNDENKTNINDNSADTTAVSQIANTLNITTHTFKTGVITPQRPRTLSPLSKVRTVSFSTPLEEESNDENNNNNTTTSTTEEVKDSENKEIIESNNSIVNNNNENNNNKQNNNSNSNNNNNSNSLVYNKQVFNKLSGGSNEIFQFDEECEEEIEKEIKQQQLLIEQQKAEENNNTNNSNNIQNIEQNQNENSDDEDDQQQRIVIGDNLRSRSNGLKQELKLGTSLPVFIPPRGSIPASHKGSVAFDTTSAIAEKENKKYVTPRQSWVEILAEKDMSTDISTSFAPQSLSRKPKSFV